MADKGVFRNRIKGLRMVKTSDLRANPKNWRRHPERQRKALRAVLEEVGYADALIAYETPEGLTLIDGHLRTDVTSDQEVPVLVLDVTEQEADKILATLDPIGAMAEANIDAVRELLAGIEAESDGLTELIESIGKETGALVPDFRTVIPEDVNRLDEEKTVICPECGHEFSP